ncbi:hypothetical protein LTR64_002901 [Lithohypha guttulata]|uniref:uncharacterized protein n=1 Tax=Lithohypha guttulata TaxID=1690604 RepID=UPI002DE1F1E7|nr:hypothetical protein LTR51_000874 [Lithohypha guttulata]
MPTANGIRRSTTKAHPPNAERLHHRINASGSVQAIVVDVDVLFAGLQGGDIVAWSLETYEQHARIKAHHQSVLGLSLSDDHKLLFSTGVDSIVNVWDSSSLQRLYSLHSPFEVGDIFCVAYSSSIQTLFCGAQNSSIQWHQLSTPAVHNGTDNGDPGSRQHRFFDSLGPGGAPNLLSHDIDGTVRAAGGQILTIASNCYQTYAHKSYIYSMVLAKGLLEDESKQEALVTADGGGTIKVWAINNLYNDGLKLLFKLKSKGLSIYTLAYKPPFLYAGLSNGKAHIYNLVSQQLVQKVDVCVADVAQIQIFGGGLYCGSNDGIVTNINNRFAKVSSWQAHQGKILATAISQLDKRKMLVTGGNDNTIAFWDISDHDAQARSQTSGNDELFSNLRQFVSYRTVAKNPACIGECHEAANFLRKLFNAFGAETSLISPQEHVNPLLLARFEASVHPQRRKTLLFYGHYDVVDAEADVGGAKWFADPFSLHPLNGYLYGRGVTDNKGPVLAALHAVAELVQDDCLACNVVFLIEGDEEAGSRGFEKVVRDHKVDIGKIDYVLLSNSYWLDDHIPCLTFGMRGVVHANIEITSGKPDQHSGMDGKALQHEPLKDLTVLLASLIGQSGMDIHIPRFYDTIDQLQPSELRAYRGIATALMAGHPEIKNEDAFTQSLMQRWREPNLTVHSITVPESKTAVTISSRAKAALSIRIVPSQNAEEIASSLKKVLEQQFDLLESRNTINVSITAKAHPWLGKVHSEIYEELRDAIMEVWSHDEASQRQFATSDDPTSPITSPTLRARGRRASVLTSAGTFTAASIPHEPLFIREGGSIPAISFLEREFGAPAAMFPMGQASDNAHLDNERIRVENLYKGRDVLKSLFSRLGTRTNFSLRNRASTVTI